MEIVIENPTDSTSMITPTPTTGYGTLPRPAVAHHSYRVPHVDGTSPTAVADYYGTLPPRGRPHLSPIQSQPAFDVTSTVRRVDKSGLLEIIEPEPSRGRPRHLTGAENSGLSATLNRRIDRSGLLEAVPEVPDQLLSQKSPDLNIKSTEERSITERHLTGAEIDHKDQTLRPCLSPRPIKTLTEHSKHEEKDSSTVHLVASSSPYSRRNLPSPKSTTESTSVIGNSDSDLRSRGQFTNVSTNPKFLTGTLESRGVRQQPYVDLTGASYTRACANSPIMVSSRTTSTLETKTVDTDDTKDTRKQPPDCLGRLSPRSKGDRQSPLTVSAIPDVIEAHGSSRVISRNTETDGPKGERAEAEGCEHTAIESLEESRVSFKASNKLLHNDNIQTLRVIILSEQL